MTFKSIAFGSAAVAGAAVAANFVYLKWFWKPDLKPFVELVSDRFMQVSDELSEVAVIVHYDQAGNVWLTGASITDHTTFQDVASVKSALSQLTKKGRAMVAQVYSAKGVGADALFAHAPAPNSELEEKLWEALHEAGFARRPSQP